MSKTAMFIALALLVIIAGSIVVMNRNNAGSETDTSDTATSQETDVTDSSSDAIASSSPSTAASVAASPSSAASTAASSSTVTITSTGYSPNVLTIKAGTTVTFKNESGRGVWIASDPHPSHTGLPGFDADKAIANGQSYSFTFTKTGSWGYHDHLNASKVGTIVVQ